MIDQLIESFWQLCEYSSGFPNDDIYLAIGAMSFLGMILSGFLCLKHIWHYEKTNQDRVFLGMIGQIGVGLCVIVGCASILWTSGNLTFNLGPMDPPASVIVHTCPNCNHVLDIDRVDENDEY